MSRNDEWKTVQQVRGYCKARSREEKQLHWIIIIAFAVALVLGTIINW
jgi:hypothetical protein